MAFELLYAYLKGTMMQEMFAGDFHVVPSTEVMERAALYFFPDNPGLSAFGVYSPHVLQCMQDIAPPASVLPLNFSFFLCDWMVISGDVVGVCYLYYGLSNAWLKAH